MTEFQTGILTLMKCAVTGEAAQLPAGFSIAEAEAFAAKQHITTLIYDGAVRCGISAKEPAMQRMFRRYLQLMLHSEQQLRELARICSAFDENGIDYLPLKGCNMKQRYPKAELRYMADADILIQVAQYGQIQQILRNLGLDEGEENHYECHWRNENVHVELHKSLFPLSSHRLFCDYWADIWNKAEKKEKAGYGLSPEDEFLYQFTHLAKHYSGAGIGCRYLLDLWVFLKSCPEMDVSCLERELQKLQLLDFYQNIQVLLAVWFEGKETDDRTEFMTQFIFSGSSWGDWLNAQVAQAVKNKRRHSQNKFSLLLAKLFPARSLMVYQYPVLKKSAFLLPVCWLMRIFRSFLFKHKDLKKGMRVMQDVTNERIAEYKAHMQYIGLYFEEE